MVTLETTKGSKKEPLLESTGLRSDLVRQFYLRQYGKNLSKIKGSDNSVDVSQKTKDISDITYKITHINDIVDMVDDSRYKSELHEPLYEFWKSPNNIDMGKISRKVLQEETNKFYNELETLIENYVPKYPKENKEETPKGINEAAFHLPYETGPPYVLINEIATLSKRLISEHHKLLDNINVPSQT